MSERAGERCSCSGRGTVAVAAGRRKEEAKPTAGWAARAVAVRLGAADNVELGACAWAVAVATVRRNRCWPWRLGPAAGRGS